MDDLISRQEAIDALDVLCQEHRYKVPGKRETYSQYNEAWQDALDRAEGAIGNLPPADIDLSGFSDKLWHIAYERGKAEAVRWISCSERLPDKKTEVIYSLENHYVSTGYMTDRDYNGDEMELHWEDIESGALIYPEAWMPLPEPYKGDDK